jgi:hypothetical protein
MPEIGAIEFLALLAAYKANQMGLSAPPPAKEKAPAKEKDTSGGTSGERVSFSREIQQDQKARNDLLPEAMNAYDKLPKDAKSKMANSLNGITKKNLTSKLEIEVDNKKSFISGHPYVTKGLGLFNGEQKGINTFDEKQKDYDNSLRDGKISKYEHTKSTEWNQRFKKMDPEQRKSFGEHMDKQPL